MTNLRLTMVAVVVSSMTVAFAADPLTLRVATADGRTVSVTAVTDNIIHVTNEGPGEKSVPTGAVIEPVAGVRTDVRTSRHGGRQILSTAAGVVAVVDDVTGGVTISAGPGRGVSDSGERVVDADGRRSLSLSPIGNCSFYGAGERGHSFNLQGDTLVMYNRQNYGYMAGEKRISQMNITMPLVVSSNGYSILFDDCAAAEMIMSDPIRYITESPAPVSYYFINGAGTLAGAVEATTALTGRQDLPPVWALGYITSKYGYHTEAETRGVVDTLKRRGYPLDGIVLDLYWYGKEQDMGRLAWDPEQWPNHKGMLADLRDRGVETVIISQPYVLRNGRGIDNFNRLQADGLLLKDSVGNPLPVTIWVGEGGMFDVSNPATREWLKNRYRELTDEGVGGWWGDLGEPEVHPEGGLHANGLTTRQYHNRYGNDWSSIIDELFTESYPDRRLMTLMRGGTTGLQRHNVFPWSTDVSRSWGGLQPQITIMLGAGMSGLGYMSHDVGGFAVDPANPVDPELYTRWLELGTFSPVLRTHAQQFAEPYHYPAEEPVLKQYIKERYRWLPYNYTLAWQNASKGEPLVRPMNYHTGDARLDSVDDQYMWGDNLLVAPVVNAGQRSREVVLPRGSVWFDYNNTGAAPLEGGQTVTVDAPLEVLPRFVKGGAIIPTADYRMDNTADFVNDRYSINFYPVEGVTDTFELFEDDHRSTDTLNPGKHALLMMSGSRDKGATVLDLSLSGSYPGMKEKRALTLNVFNTAAEPAEVVVDGRKLKRGAWKYDKAGKCLTVKIDWRVAKPMSVIVR